MRKCGATRTSFPTFEGVDRSGLKRRQRAFMATALGGSRTDFWVARLAFARSLEHARSRITTDAFDRVVAKLRDTLPELGVRSELIDRIAWDAYASVRRCQADEEQPRSRGRRGEDSTAASTGPAGAAWCPVAPLLIVLNLN
jgi:truncated hemoglobin YjbI